jgi:hypothetical protein
MADDEVLVGLLDWINSLQVAEDVRMAEDMSDGKVVWKVLRMETYLVTLCMHIDDYQSRSID